MMVLPPDRRRSCAGGSVTCRGDGINQGCPTCGPPAVFMYYHSIHLKSTFPMEESMSAFTVSKGETSSSSAAVSGPREPDGWLCSQHIADQVRQTGAANKVTYRCDSTQHETCVSSLSAVKNLPGRCNQTKIQNTVTGTPPIVR
jgi:hypothetical protein